MSFFSPFLSNDNNYSEGDILEELEDDELVLFEITSA